MMKLNPQMLLKKLDGLLETWTARLTKVHKLLILAAVWAVPAAAFILLVFMPKTEEMGQLRDRISRLNNEISGLRTVAAQLDQHKAKMAEVEEHLRIASLLLPEEREIPHLLTNISNLGTDAGLDFILFRPQAEVRKEFYAEIPVDISVRGPYHQVGNFLDQISKLPRVVTVSNLNMGSPSPAGGIMNLSTTFTLLTYRFIEPEPEPPPQARQPTRRR
ncbi:type 4a pilus biogenesis protein PilO [Desulfurivibrio sp. D14AmB]|uniref:type 4a pilus biogenesis protein PilO n=1 Tax=Desulfurivibrio sp. D14AmB TaxID=3374370 RepID=UPI00376F1965